MTEDILSLRSLKDTAETAETQNVNTELQNLQMRLTSLEEEKDQLDELLKLATEKGIHLNSDLKDREEKVRITNHICVRTAICCEITYIYYLGLFVDTSVD